MPLQFLDYLCIALYMGTIIALGSYFSRSQRSTKDFFLAGKSMTWLPLAISMYASLFSSNSYVAAPAMAFRDGIVYLMALAVFPIASVFAILIFVDFFTRLRITTVFEYLEARYNRAVSLISLIGYMVFRGTYAGIVVYSLSLVLQITMGIPLVPTMVAVGIGAIIYTRLGGMKAVIWTDVIQFFVLLAGIFLALYLAIDKMPGGLAEAWRLAAETDKLKVIQTNVNTGSGINSFVIWLLVPFGVIDFLGSKSVDQMNVQRYLSAKTPRNAKMALLVQSFFTLPVWILLFAVGTCLFAYYHHNPSPVVDGFIKANKHDRIFPYYIFQVMPVGVRGFMIAALLAAAMSTMDSVLHVLATVMVTDIYKRYINPQADDRRNLTVARNLIVGWGIFIILAAIGMQNIESILRTTNKVIGIFVGPMMGIFLLGMFFRRMNWQGAICGLLLGFATGYFLFRWKLPFTVYGMSSLLAVLVFGGLSSLLFPAPAAEKTDGHMWKWHGFREMLVGGGDGSPSAGFDKPRSRS